MSPSITWSIRSLVRNFLLWGFCLLPNWILCLPFWHVVQTWWLPTSLGNTLLFLGSLTKPQPHSCLEQRFLISDTMCQTGGPEWFYDTVLAKETQGKVWTGWGNSGKEWFSVTGGWSVRKRVCPALPSVPCLQLSWVVMMLELLPLLRCYEGELQRTAEPWSQWALNQANQPPISQPGMWQGNSLLIEDIPSQLSWELQLDLL